MLKKNGIKEKRKRRKKNEVQKEKQKKKRPKKRKFQPYHIEHRKAIAEHN